MIINPALPSGHTIFCDDVRHEVTGKVTFVGTYTNTMIINGTLPTNLPKLCLGIVYREESDSAEPVMIKVFMPGKEDDDPAIQVGFEPQADMIAPPTTDEFTFREARVFVEMPNVAIEKEGLIRVRAYRGDDEVRLGALVVTVNPVAEGEQVKGSA
jgi:hypothetical protein